MTETNASTTWQRIRRLGSFVAGETKPKGKLLTPFNMISGALMVTTVILLIIRFAKGLGSITNLSQDTPWGLWIGFDVVTGVAFAGGAYVVTFLVYILRLEQYKPICRATVLNGLLAYIFYAGALLLDLGRPWNVINPIIGNGFGVSSVLFLVAWHFLLYMLAEFLEFSPAIAEWLGLKRARRILSGATIAAVIFGITLSTLHQSGLGALYLMAKPKIHPLWYSEFIPILFFVSSIFAGLAMVIVEGTISHRVFADKLTHSLRHSHDNIVIGLGRICAGALFVYFFLQVLTFVHGHHWVYLGTGWGSWYLLEVIGFVGLPLILFTQGVRDKALFQIRIAAILTLVGVILNRLNVTTVAFKWYAASHYLPSWMEIVVTLGVISAEIWVFRWIVNRMPVLSDSPEWVSENEGPRLSVRSNQTRRV
jgi:Ni/Fe-hydrogenase subunit HybB-like protein